MSAVTEIKKKFSRHVKKVHAREAVYSTEFKKALLAAYKKGQATQAELAEAFEIDPSVISDWNRGALPIKNKRNSKKAA